MIKSNLCLRLYRMCGAGRDFSWRDDDCPQQCHNYSTDGVTLRIKGISAQKNISKHLIMMFDHL